MLWSDWWTKSLISEEQLKAFLEKTTDTNLQEKLKGADDDDAVLEIAKEAGFVISADKLTETHSDEDLEVVAGWLLQYYHPIVSKSRQTVASIAETPPMLTY